MDNSISKTDTDYSPACGKIQPWKTFLSKNEVSTQIMVNAKGGDDKNKQDEAIPGSAGEVNRDIEYDTGNYQPAISKEVRSQISTSVHLLIELQAQGTDLRCELCGETWDTGVARMVTQIFSWSETQFLQQKTNTLLYTSLL